MASNTKKKKKKRNVAARCGWCLPPWRWRDTICLLSGMCPRSVYWPDSVRQVVPAEVDGPGAVLDRLAEGQRAGAGQVGAGLLGVTVKHWTQGGGDRWRRRRLWKHHCRGWRHEWDRRTGQKMMMTAAAAASAADLVCRPGGRWGAAGPRRQPAAFLCRPGWPRPPGWSPLQKGGALRSAKHQTHLARRRRKPPGF